MHGDVKSATCCYPYLFTTLLKKGPVCLGSGLTFLKEKAFRDRFCFQISSHLILLNDFYTSLDVRKMS